MDTGAADAADVDALVVAMVRGAFEYQGQKCSAVSRTYIPESMWPELREKLVAMTRSIKMGSPEDFTNFFNAVIDEKVWRVQATIQSMLNRGLKERKAIFW